MAYWGDSFGLEGRGFFFTCLLSYLESMVGCSLWFCVWFALLLHRGYICSYAASCGEIMWFEFPALAICHSARSALPTGYPPWPEETT